MRFFILLLPIYPHGIGSHLQHRCITVVVLGLGKEEDRQANPLSTNTTAGGLDR